MSLSDNCSPQTRFWGIAELAESVLIRLTPVELLRCRQVSKALLTAVESSRPIRRKLGLLPSHIESDRGKLLYHVRGFAYLETQAHGNKGIHIRITPGLNFNAARKSKILRRIHIAKNPPDCAIFRRVCGGKNCPVREQTHVWSGNQLLTFDMVFQILDKLLPVCCICESWEYVQIDASYLCERKGVSTKTSKQTRKRR